MVADPMDTNLSCQNLKSKQEYILEEQKAAILRIPILIRTEDDQLVWPLCNEWGTDSKSAYGFLKDREQSQIIYKSSSLHNLEQRVWNII